MTSCTEAVPWSVPPEPLARAVRPNSEKVASATRLRNVEDSVVKKASMAASSWAISCG